MNINQRQNILNNIQMIRELDLDDVFIKAYPDEIDIRNVNVKKYSALDLKSLIKKCINSINTEIETSIGLILPIEQNFANEYGNINLESTLSNIHSYLVNSQLEYVEREIDKLIFYQISFGFWEKSRIKMHSFDEKEVRTAIDSLQIGKKSLDKLLNVAAVLENKYSKQLEDLENLISTKNLEFQDIKIGQGVAASEIEKIKELDQQAKAIVEEINKLRNLHNDIVEKASAIAEGYKINFDKFSSQEQDLTTQLNTKIITADEQLKEARSSLDFMSSKEADIRKLTGYAADGALGSKFDERRTLLQKDLKFWITAVVVTSILSLIWVVTVFTVLKSDMDDKWLTLIVNLAKTAPAWFLLGFVVNHYNRERAIQEEYAFKSAVAMTLTAYSEMLENADGVDNDSRQKMLCKAIEQLYTQPKIHVDRNDRVYAFSTKSLTESVKELTEVVRAAKGS